MPFIRRDKRSKKSGGDAVAVASAAHLANLAAIAPQPVHPRNLIPPRTPRGQWVEEQVLLESFLTDDDRRVAAAPPAPRGTGEDRYGRPLTFDPVPPRHVPAVNYSLAHAKLDGLVHQGIVQVRRVDGVRQCYVLSDAEIDVLEHDRREATERKRGEVNVVLTNPEGFQVLVRQQDEERVRAEFAAENRRRAAANMRATLDEKPVPYPLQAGAVPFTGI